MYKNMSICEAERERGEGEREREKSKFNIVSNYVNLFTRSDKISISKIKTNFFKNK